MTAHVFDDFLEDPIQFILTFLGVILHFYQSRFRLLVETTVL